MSILTISHEIGAGGPEIGQKVAEQLGLHYVDQELISDAAGSTRLENPAPRLLMWRTSHRRHDRRRTIGTEHLPASRVEVRCAGPVAGHFRIAGAHRDHLPPCPALRSGGWNRAAPGSCRRRVPVLAARELPANGPLAVPTPRPPVARHLLADPPGMSARDGAGLRQDQSLDLVRTPRPEPARRPAQRVHRGDRPVAGQPRWPGHRR